MRQPTPTAVLMPVFSAADLRAHLCLLCGGWGGIRTHEGREPLPVFKTGAFNRSATHPHEDNQQLKLGHHGEQPANIATRLAPEPYHARPRPAKASSIASDESLSSLAEQVRRHFEPDVRRRVAEPLADRHDIAAGIDQLRGARKLRRGAPMPRQRRNRASPASGPPMRR
jgi:hypothetical protein